MASNTGLTEKEKGTADIFMKRLAWGIEGGLDPTVHYSINFMLEVAIMSRKNEHGERGSDFHHYQIGEILDKMITHVKWLRGSNPKQEWKDQCDAVLKNCKAWKRIF